MIMKNINHDKQLFRQESSRVMQIASQRPSELPSYSICIHGFLTFIVLGFNPDVRGLPSTLYTRRLSSGVIRSTLLIFAVSLPMDLSSGAAGICSNNPDIFRLCVTHMSVSRATVIYPRIPVIFIEDSF
jgi:hypothetical protein